MPPISWSPPSGPLHVLCCTARPKAFSRTAPVERVVDCTGAESRLTTRRGPDVGAPIPPPGFQVAYGVECLVRDLGPYADDAMLLFDYRILHRGLPNQSAVARPVAYVVYSAPGRLTEAVNLIVTLRLSAISKAATL